MYDMDAVRVKFPSLDLAKGIRKSEENVSSAERGAHRVAMIADILKLQAITSHYKTEHAVYLLCHGAPEDEFCWEDESDELFSTVADLEGCLYSCYAFLETLIENKSILAWKKLFNDIDYLCAYVSSESELGGAIDEEYVYEQLTIAHDGIFALDWQLEAVLGALLEP